MEIRDFIHGAIHIEPHEHPIVDSRFFQRLRQIKQLGFAEYSFPSATHNRFIHSVGAMETVTRILDSILNSHSVFQQTPRLKRFRSISRLSALLHDIGHGPLSHTTEFAMPEVSKLKIPGFATRGRRATHEDYTLKILLDSTLTPLLEEAGKIDGFKPIHIAALIDPAIEISDDYFIETVENERVDFRPLLHQLISSELDADRMDYLRRDSHAAGVSYGVFDFDWITQNLTAHITSKPNDKNTPACYLALEHRALYSLEDFLISRFHMFLLVYFHHKSVIYDEMLEQYLTDKRCDYKIPSDIEEYIHYHDSHLSSHLSKSPNIWARRITEKRPYRLLIELHSGIPATPRSLQEQSQLLSKVKKRLKTDSIHSLMDTSTSEISKYFGKNAFPIFIRYDNRYSAPMFIPLEKCTDLFERYREKRSITRIFVSPEDYPRCRYAGRAEILPYEDN